MKKMFKWCFVAMFGFAVVASTVFDAYASQMATLSSPDGNTPITGSFDTHKIPCPNCGEVGKLVRVNNIDNKPVENIYCCLSCLSYFEIIQR